MSTKAWLEVSWILITALLQLFDSLVNGLFGILSVFHLNHLYISSFHAVVVTLSPMPGLFDRYRHHGCKVTCLNWLKGHNISVIVFLAKYWLLHYKRKLQDASSVQCLKLLWQTNKWNISVSCVFCLFVLIVVDIYHLYHWYRTLFYALWYISAGSTWNTNTTLCHIPSLLFMKCSFSSSSLTMNLHRMRSLTCRSNHMSQFCIFTSQFFIEYLDKMFINSNTLQAHPV